MLLHTGTDYTLSCFAFRLAINWPSSLTRRVYLLQPSLPLDRGKCVYFKESASQNRCPIRSAASQWALLRKVYPGMSPQSGTRFPKPAPTGSCVPEFAYRAGCNFRLSLDWEMTSHSYKNGRLGCLSEPPV